jgi:hypothetical protein
MAPITITASTIRPVILLRLSWRIIQIKKATSGITNIRKNTIEANGIFFWLFGYLIIED